MTSSNLQIKSNLMVDDGKKKQKLYFPGDLILQLHPSWKDSRVIEKQLTLKQINEYHQTMICYLCKKPCAGTCGLSYSD